MLKKLVIVGSLLAVGPFFSGCYMPPIKDALTEFGYLNGAWALQHGVNLYEVITTIKTQADSGSAEAKYLMYLIYHTGEGLQADKDKAKRYLAKAVRLGDKHANLDLPNTRPALVSLMNAKWQALSGMPATALQPVGTDIPKNILGVLKRQRQKEQCEEQTRRKKRAEEIKKVEAQNQKEEKLRRTAEAEKQQEADAKRRT